ncbi:MAG TPA: hypothetical protein VMV76_07270 [Dehalococcoidia bacterium]|nr:hypothetical protein [Dehalococcoidia bacterium]
MPFVSVARGNKSNLTYLVALKLADLVVTGSGFGVDCRGHPKAII